MSSTYEPINENAFKQLFKDKFAKAAFIILALMYILVFLAQFISPYDKHYSDRDHSYAPPSKIYVIDQNGKLSLPYTYNYNRHFDFENFDVTYSEDRTHKYYVKYFAKGEPYKLFGVIPFDRHFYNVEQGGKLYLLGTDINGRIFQKVFFAGFVSNLTDSKHSGFPYLFVFVGKKRGGGNR